MTVLNPQDQPHPDEKDALPGEEGVDAADVSERLGEDPDEARNRTDGYAPADDPDAEVFDGDDVED